MLTNELKYGKLPRMQERYEQPLRNAGQRGILCTRLIMTNEVMLPDVGVLSGYLRLRLGWNGGTVILLNVVLEGAIFVWRAGVT